MRFASTFERLELKYLITEDRAEYVRQLIRPYCHPDPYNAPGSDDPTTDGVRGYQIDNLYLDSPSTYELHRMWRRADADRIKLRIRTYDDDGPAFLEMKRKVSRIIAKERCAVDRRDIRDVVHGFGGPLVDSPEQRAIYERFAHAVAKVGPDLRSVSDTSGRPGSAATSATRASPSTAGSALSRRPTGACAATRTDRGCASTRRGCSTGCAHRSCSSSSARTGCRCGCRR